MSSNAVFLAPQKRLGDLLVEAGIITRAALEAHLKHAMGRMGDSLRAHGLIAPRTLSKLLADAQALPFIDFESLPPNPRLFRPHDFAHYTRHHYVPFARAADGLIIATSEPSDALRTLLEEYYATNVRLIVTGAQDLRNYFASVAATASTRQARLALRRKFRHLTADQTLAPHQTTGLGVLAGVLLGLLILAPHHSWEGLLILCNLFYFACLWIRLRFQREGQKQARLQQAALPALAQLARRLSDAELPIYTILVPLYGESRAVMQRLIYNLCALDYPREKLDIKLICEADDWLTLEALKSLKPPSMMEIIPVAPSQPRTKPKACNVALPHVRGEFLVIYDAEDMPAPSQLKLAVAMFRNTREHVACLQASLNYYNREENLLTQLFSIEYSALFRLNLPALERLNLPIPLGGTSNHLRVRALREVGGWDPFNVTEDADLGIRLAYLGYKTRLLPSLTLEEAPVTLSAWRKQRTRWIKGYIQTWLVYMRDPAALKRHLGQSGYYGFQYFVGTPALTFLIAPFFWVSYGVSHAGYLPYPTLSLFTESLCLVALVGGMVCNWWTALVTMRIEGWQDMPRALAVYPFYWVLHSIAAACALWQLITRPHHWNKTRHGVSRLMG